MKNAQLLDEIRETNMSYLLLAQHLIGSDRTAAMFRLGVRAEVADIIEQLSPAQIMKMAASNMLLCRMRFDDQLIVGLLSDHSAAKPMMQSHAAVLMAGQSPAGLS